MNLMKMVILQNCSKKIEMHYDCPKILTLFFCDISSITVELLFFNNFDVMDDYCY